MNISNSWKLPRGPNRTAAATATEQSETHTHPFNGPFSGTTQVSRYQKGKTNLDFTEARDSGISWAICKSAPCSRQITMPVPHHSVFLQAGCPSCRQQCQSTAATEHSENAFKIWRTDKEEQWDMHQQSQNQNKVNKWQQDLTNRLRSFLQSLVE